METIDDFEVLMLNSPSLAIDKVSSLIETCSDCLRELYDDDDLDTTDWLCLYGARLSEIDPDEVDVDKVDDFDVYYQPIDRVPSVLLEILETSYFVPLTHAIYIALGHFEVTIDEMLECQLIIGKTATATGDMSWDGLESSMTELVKLQSAISDHLFPLLPVRDVVHDGHLLAKISIQRVAAQ